MIYFDRPGLILLVSLGIFGPLTGLAFVRVMNYITLKDWKTPPGVDALFSGLTLSSIILFVGVIISATIAKMYDEYEDMKSGTGRPAVNTPQPVEEVKPRIFADGKLVNAFDTPKLKIDARRHMAIQQWRTLEYHNGDASKLNWTEDYWLGGGWIDKKKKELGKHTRKWKGKNDEFRQTMHDWDGAVIQKKDPTRDNSEYVLRSKAELKRKADGR